jgi:predicted AAA+ superfamily ATPase
MRRLWSMLAHVHGQTANFTQVAGSLGVSDMTARRYLDLLVQTFMVRALQPWHENLSKRQVKAPKVYLRDCGLQHFLLGLKDEVQVRGSPYAGASFEGLVVEALIQMLGLTDRECFFWGTYQGAELDFLAVRGGRKWGFEVKLSSAPEVTRSMRIALEDLQLERLDVIHAGTETFPMAPRIRAVAIGRLTRDVHL